MNTDLTLKFHAANKFGKVSERGIHLLKPEQRDIDNALQSIDRDGFDTVHIYSDALEILNGHAWKRPDSYMGPQYFGYIDVVGRHRDSDLVTNSNYEAISKELAGKFGALEPFTWDDEEFPIVETASASHWAVGWCETIMVHWSNLEALTLAAEILKALENYPIYDDSAYSEACMEYRDEDYRLYADDWKKNILKFLGLKRFGNKSEWETVLSVLHDAACSWSGEEQAYIDTSNVKRLSEHCYELKEAAREGNKVAARILKHAGVES